ncbi:MAG: hypothetical protein NTZ39_00890 [Methanoregula sp.]|nr:hypothetical protein [Methanoregula sp.]
MTEIQHSDALKNLVIFIIALAILGTIIALAWYFAVELPIQQAAIHAPVNTIISLITLISSEPHPAGGVPRSRECRQMTA